MTDAADPTLPQPEPAPAAAPFQSVLISVDAPPKPRRGKWIALIAVLALLVGGFVTYLATAGDGEGVSLEKALAKSKDAHSVAVSMTMTLGVLGGISIDARSDNDAQLMAMTMDMAVLGMGKVDMIVDLSDGTTFVSSDLLAESGVDIPTKWGKVTGTDPLGLGLGGLGVGTNPADTASIIDLANEVKELGATEFHGEKVHHYQATLDFADAMGSNPEFADQLDQLGLDAPTELVYDLYVTSGNELRGVAFAFDLMGQTMSIEMVLTDYNDIDPIELPDPSDVTETELPGM